MRIGIYGAGAFCQEIDHNIAYIGVDGGIDHLKKLGIQPLYAIGDFDSIQSKDNLGEAIVLPTNKDVTDTEAAIMLALSKGYDELYLYGVCGQRLDHFIAIIRLLMKYKNIKITVFDDWNKIYMIDGKTSIEKDDYDYLSFFSILPTTIDITGVKYPLHQYHLTYDDPLCVSNEIIDTKAWVIVDKPTLCIQSRRSLCAF